MATTKKVDLFEDRDLYRGEIRRKGISVFRSDGISIIVTSAKFRVHKRDGTPLTEEADAEIQDNDTPVVKIYADVAAGDEPGGRYVEFTYVIGGMIGKARLTYNVVQ